MVVLVYDVEIASFVYVIFFPPSTKICTYCYVVVVCSTVIVMTYDAPYRRIPVVTAITKLITISSRYPLPRAGFCQTGHAFISFFFFRSSKIDSCAPYTRKQHHPYVVTRYGSCRIRFRLGVATPRDARHDVTLFRISSSAGLSFSVRAARPSPVVHLYVHAHASSLRGWRRRRLVSCCCCCCCRCSTSAVCPVDAGPPRPRWWSAPKKKSTNAFFAFGLFTRR